MAAADLTTRARIRDAAIHRFGADGFAASVRSIATQAGVSPGLVIHHFGSKDALRAACDEYVLQVIRESKSRALTPGSASDLLAQLADVEEYTPLVAYMVQGMLAGGDLAVAFLDQMIADAEGYLATGVEAGTVRPSRDPAARARYLVLANVGALLLHVRLHPPVDGDYAATIRELTALTAVPALEIFTEGLLTDRTMLDSYLVYVPDPPRR
ncbi:TetR family transcriptional regulator [Pseudonocardia asaccharolytica DSM 44247 = NBRC 16224]|uniref:TetR family transcriptional regulator n=1 Tax=Pseudonocardia asaccharolytica DSM 44247 = NBRC 16224 TaxID=1123024 RepID=A0A511D615_9PSEU|nr:TetR family transcriptional regulator [Pseudonocardia asaccharolytica DSM 44247 = NBRC 16224]